MNVTNWLWNYKKCFWIWIESPCSHVQKFYLTIFDKILPKLHRAEFCLIFCSFFGQWCFKKKCFWDLLTFINCIFQNAFDVLCFAWWSTIFNRIVKKVHFCLLLAMEIIVRRTCSSTVKVKKMFLMIYHYNLDENGSYLSSRYCQTNWFEMKDKSFQACGEESFQFPFQGDKKLGTFFNVKNQVQKDRELELYHKKPVKRPLTVAQHARILKQLRLVLDFVLY